jgi:hypothetical protein
LICVKEGAFSLYHYHPVNTLLLVVVGLLVIGLAVSLVMLPIAIVFNLEAGKRYRRDLAVKLDRLRLGRMLAALGIDIDVYLNHERIVEIDQQMRRCAACTNTDTCDDNLRMGGIAADNIGYCNNEQSLQAMLKKQETP